MGSITKTDIQYAQAYECPIYCFRVKRPLRHEQSAIDRYGVRALYYSHHQHLIDEIESNMLLEYERRKERAVETERLAAAKAKGRELTARLEEDEEEVEGEDGEKEASEVQGVEAEVDVEEREEWERFIEPTQEQVEGQRV